MKKQAIQYTEAINDIGGHGAGSLPEQAAINDIGGHGAGSLSRAHGSTRSRPAWCSTI
ncbi:MAG TPA: hypothetical protein VGD37_12550 [Kofleriaceae bacterium]